MTSFINTLRGISSLHQINPDSGLYHISTIHQPFVLMKCNNDRYNSIDKELLAGSISIDIKKAFYTMDQNILYQ